MGRDSKALQLRRLAELADVMKQGLSYQRCYEWYQERWGKSEKTFQKDRGLIYKQWKESIKKDLEIDLIDLLNKLESDRTLARELGQIGAAIQALKLEAQLKGIISKQGEVNVENQQINNLNLNLNNLTLDELLKLLNNG